MKLRNLGNNQSELVLNNRRILISYETPVAIEYTTTGKCVKTSENHSATTTRHINRWLNGANAELEPQSYFDDVLNAVNMG